jgi:hypothetical protein
MSVILIRPDDQVKEMVTSFLSGTVPVRTYGTGARAPLINICY